MLTRVVSIYYLFRLFNDSEITESRTAFVQSSSYGVYNLTLKDVSSDMTGKYTCKIANELGTTETSASYSVHSNVTN